MNTSCIRRGVEYKPGTILSKKFKAYLGSSCKDCVVKNHEKCKDILCSKEERKDEKDIYFRRIT